MPSYRITLGIGRLAPGVSPDAVLPAAAEAAAELAVVEASDLAVVAGAPRITVRFTDDDDANALDVGQRVLERIARVAEPLSWAVSVRDQGRWYLVR